MTETVITFYKFKVGFFVSLLLYLVITHDNIFQCDLWVIAFIRIIHRLPWLLPIFKGDNLILYQVINQIISMMLHMSLLVTKYEPNHSGSNCDKNLVNVIYFETHLVVAMFVIFGGILLLAVCDAKYYSKKIDKKIVLNSISFNDIIKWNQADRNCCICIDNFNNDDLLAKIKCGHFDHLECMNEWIKKSLCCPRCRSAI